MFRFGVMLQEKCDKDALEAIILCSEYYKWLTRLPVQPSDFVPLRLFRNLTHLDVEKGCSMSISNDDLCELVGT